MDGKPNVSGSEGDGDGRPPDVCNYPTRHEILAAASHGPSGSSPQRSGPQPDRLVLKTGERAQYFVVNSNPGVYTARALTNPSTLGRGAKLATVTESSPSKPPPAPEHQTDDLKLKLRTTDSPPHGRYKRTEREELSSASESKPLISPNPGGDEIEYNDSPGHSQPNHRPPDQSPDGGSPP